MKKFAFLLCFAAITSAASAQAGKLPVLDKSPMDMAYYPHNFPVLKIQEKAAEPLVARVIYSRPLKNGRTVFGELVEFNKVWRMGANEATEIELFVPATIQNKRINRGRYILYSIPYADRWTIVFNSNTFSWGLKPDPAKDLYRFDIPVQTSAGNAENYTIEFKKTDTGAELLMAWDDAAARLPIAF